MPTKEQILQDLLDEKNAVKNERAYNKAMPEPDTTYGKLQDDAVTLPGKFPKGTTVESLLKPQKRTGIEGAEKLPEKPPKGTNLNKFIEDMNKKSSSGGTSNKDMIPLKKGGSVSSASKRADGCAVKGKTKGRFV
jgi:hypothetical protein